VFFLILACRGSLGSRGLTTSLLASNRCLSHPSLNTRSLLATIIHSALATKANVLELDNTTAFTPDADYEPATKKYVDDNAGGGAAAGADTQVQFNDNGALGASPDMTYDGDKLEIKATDFNQNNSTIKVVDFNGNLMMDLRNNGTVNFGNFQFLNAANRFIFDGLIVFQKSGAGLYFGPAGTLLSFQGSNARLVLRGYGVTINRGIATANAALDVQSVRTSQPVSIFALASGQLTDLAQWNNFAGAILAKIDATGKIQASGYKSSDDSEGVTTTFLNGDGNTVTVKNGLITNIS